MNDWVRVSYTILTMRVDDRKEIQPNIWLLTLRGSLALCPKGNEPAKRALDLGTRTGCWAIEYGESEKRQSLFLLTLSEADAFPKSEVRYSIPCWDRLLIL